MHGRNKAARILFSSAAMVLIAAALLHLSDYTKDMRAVAASSLRASMQGEVRSLFFLVGWDWLAIAIIMLISAVAGQELRKVVVLFCGFSLLVTLAVMVAFMGWFWGCGIITLSALMILCGGLLFRNTAD
jgi:hypothetical protein